MIDSDDYGRPLLRRHRIRRPAQRAGPTLALRVGRGAARPVGREEAATALGITRALATFHLDRLADGGLLESAYRRLTSGADRVRGGRRGSTGGRIGRSPSACRNAATSWRPMSSPGPEDAPRQRTRPRAARAAGHEIGTRARHGRRRSAGRVLREALEAQGYELAYRIRTAWSGSATAPSTPSSTSTGRWCAG